MKGVERLKMKFGGKKYDTRFTNTGIKKKIMLDMHKIAVDVTFTLMTAKKGINTHLEQAVSAMNKDYYRIEDIKVMGALDLDSLKKSQKRVALHAINLI